MMIEKLIENWLTSTNERGYMPAFCQLLVSEGYQLLYVSPHGPDEAGKDIIAVNPKNKIVCFQLKNGDLGLSEFRSIEGELSELLKHPIIHPSIPKRTKFISQLVINGRVKDPVRSRITQLNDVNWNESKTTKLDYIQKDQLAQKFIQHYGNFFPQEAKNFKNFLEFYMADGHDFLNKLLFCDFLESHFDIKSKKILKAQVAHLISSSLILVNYAINPWINSKNYVAQIEAWVCLLSYIYKQVDKYKLQDKYWKQSEIIINTFIENNFKELLGEVNQRHHLIEGDWPSDGIVYPARATIVLGYINSYALYRILQCNPLDTDTQKKILELNIKYESKLRFWGEVFGPHLFSYFWFNLRNGRLKEALGRFSSMLYGLVDTKKAPQPYGFPNPYYNYEDTVRIINGLSIDDPKQHFVGESYSMWSIIETFARRGARNVLGDLWKKITRVQYLELVPTNKFDYFSWKVDKGKLIEKFPKQTQSWKELVDEANSTDFSKLPDLLISKPDFTLLFILVFPHRLSPQIVKLIDTKLSQ